MYVCNLGTSGGGISPGQRRKGAVNAERKRLPENLLIEPSQVSVFERTVHTAEAVLTPLGKSRLFPIPFSYIPRLR